MALVNPKTFVYHSYKNGAFQGIFNNVISHFTHQQEINSAGATITITLGAPADNFGEGTLVDFNNEVDVYVIDDETPNGTLVFKGFIVNYQPVFSDTNQEQVILTVMGFGATLNDYMIESGESVDVNANTQNSTVLAAAGDARTGVGIVNVVQSFTTGAGITKLSAVEFIMAAFTQQDVGDIIVVSVYASQTDAEGNTHAAAAIATASLPITSLASANYKFTFATPVTVIPATTYWVQIANITAAFSSGSPYGVNVYYDNTAPYSGGILEMCTFLNPGYAVSPVSGDAYIKTYSSTGSTTSAYNSQDPSAILKSIIDNYNLQGGKITYTASSIDLTGTTVSYTFNTNTVFEGINKCLQMAPVGWYFYIDETTNVLHFHKISSTPTHTFILGKNIKNLSIEKRAQDIVNVVYFVGGPTASVNLFQKYVLQTSIDLYGRHAIRYSDNNVTLAATAQIIANSILSNQGQIELRIEMDIVDNGGSTTSIFGFNIESVTLGESISFRSFGASSGGSLWDVAKWDRNKWDFDITDLSSVVVQVTRIDYSPDILHLSLSTVPPDITKRVQDIYRNLSQVNTLNNPSTPS